MRLFPILFLVTCAWSQAAASTVYIGSSAKGEQSGIYRAELDPATGKLSTPVRVATIEGAGFLTLSPDGRHAISTGTGPAEDGKPGGLVAAWARGQDGGQWKLLGTQPSGGGICHVSVSPDGKTVMAANYGGGSVASFRFEKEKGLSPRLSLAKHTGKGPSQPRQDAPHAHAIVPLPGGNFAAAPDLGIDTVVIYRWDSATSTLQEHGRATTPPGSGPRHLAVHPNGKIIYVVNELDHTVSVFGWDAQTGRLTAKHLAQGRPPDMPPTDLTSAEIRVSPDGKIVYTSTRDLSTQGRDFLTVFQADADGQLTPVQHAAAGVSTPRNFALSPDGKWLLAGGQKSNTIQVHAIDPESGKLSPAGQPVPCPAPACFVFEKN